MLLAVCHRPIVPRTHRIPTVWDRGKQTSELVATQNYPCDAIHLLPCSSREPHYLKTKKKKKLIRTQGCTLQNLVALTNAEKELRKNTHSYTAVAVLVASPSLPQRRRWQTESTCFSVVLAIFCISLRLFSPQL